MKSKATQFKEWLREPVEWAGQPIRRSAVLEQFVDDGLLPFLKRKGYVLAITDEHFRNCVATGLFDNRTKSHTASVWPGSFNPDGATAEEEAHFHYVMDSEAWGAFWAAWGTWTDVDVGSFRGQDRRMDIEAFVWSCIDLDASPQTEELLAILRGGEDEEDVSALSLLGRQGADTYLQETVEYNGWAGYRR